MKRSARDVAWVRALLDRTGAMEHARTMAHGMGGAALYEFDRYFAQVPQGRDLRFVRSMLTWVMQRTH